MLLKSDSILVSQPLLLDIKQRRFITGIRFSAETTHFFFRKLLKSLAEWGDLPTTISRADKHLEIFSFAWALVDNVRRFHRLLWKAPGIKNLPSSASFVKKWEGELRDIRNAMQHPDGDYMKTMKENYVYGSIYWVDSRRRLENKQIVTHMLSAGPQANRSTKEVVLPTLLIDSGDDIYQIVLTTAGASVQLELIVADMVSALLDIEKWVLETYLKIKDEIPAFDAERRRKMEMRAQSDQNVRLEVDVSNVPID
ncbi:hypothetical protein [Sphingomonas abaci]|uniref:Uncharacterized protein n=1 Tax=Sphingomonas abaci TaxID=237611 RepID=A0A7W7F190_9SPHN|nr:hypothetical protein [Sphingomonas abaci]MBB4619130.1 hypothetical protein [Sphingomonas abaci]